MQSIIFRSQHNTNKTSIHFVLFFYKISLILISIRYVIAFIASVSICIYATRLIYNLSGECIIFESTSQICSQLYNPDFVSFLNISEFSNVSCVFCDLTTNYCLQIAHPRHEGGKECRIHFSICHVHTYVYNIHIQVVEYDFSLIGQCG